MSLDAAGCNVNLTVTDTKEYIATSGYPFNYLNNRECEYNFNAPPGRKIIVLFEDFQLEEGFDFLYFRKSHNTH